MWKNHVTPRYIKRRARPLNLYGELLGAAVLPAGVPASSAAATSDYEVVIGSAVLVGGEGTRE
jgi:hypothetical protein